MEQIQKNLRVAQSVADAEKGLILASVDVPTTQEKAFKALSEAKQIEEWWGSSDTYRMTKWVDDFKVGGTYTVDVVNANGDVKPASGKFLEINIPSKFSHTRIYEWDFPILGRRETTITYNFNKIENGTRVTVRHEGFLNYDIPAYEHADGWIRVLNWLKSFLSKSQY